MTPPFIVFQELTDEDLMQKRREAWERYQAALFHGEKAEDLIAKLKLFNDLELEKKRRLRSVRGRV